MSRRVLGAANAAAAVPGMAIVMSGMAIVALGMAIGLSGCGSSDPTAGTEGRPATKTSRPAGDNHPDMVAAVNASKTAGAVELYFSIPSAPVVGQPIDIQLVITPLTDLERIIARFQATEGLEVMHGAESGPHDNPARGVEIPHTLTVRPKADGVYAIQAIVLSDSDTQSVSRTFSIPIIVGAGTSASPPKN